MPCNSIAATYHLTIGVTDVKNEIQNTLKVSTEHNIIKFPPDYITW